MAIDGFYMVDFSALVQGVRGVVVVDNGLVRGGDDQYLYAGTVSGPDERLHVTLTVKSYVQGAVSVFNTVGGKFELQLTGNVVGQDLHFTGPAPIAGSPGITIHARKISDLALS